MTALAALFARVIRHVRQLFLDALEDLPVDGTEPEDSVDPVVVLHRAAGYLALLGVVVLQVYARSLASVPKAVLTLFDLYAEAVLRRVQHSGPLPN